MNDKFFDLARKKQDRMINGALEVFAKNGYRRASTDDMVKAVGVSKGLWFHYFGSKLGIYTFVYEYSVKYMLLEISTVVDEGETDFFEMSRQIEQVNMRVSKNYPYMVRMLEEAVNETDEDALDETEDSRKALEDKLGSLIKNTEIDGITDKNKREKIKKLTYYAINGIKRERYNSGTEPEAVYREIRTYLDLIRQMSKVYSDDENVKTDRIFGTINDAVHTGTGKISAPDFKV